MKWGRDTGEDIAKVNTDAFDSRFDPMLQRHVGISFNTWEKPAAHLVTQ